MNRPRITYQPGLDGLRALAVGAVIAYHLDYRWAQGGFLGVDAFFVLSGFLITSLLLAEHRDTEGISLGAFWGRRARRLLPALFLMLTVVCLYAAWNVPAIQLGRLRADAISSIFYFANWHFIAAGQSYFDLFTSPLPLNHLWSLAIEEQFYLVWPLVVLALLKLGRGSRQYLTGVTILGILYSQLAMVMLYTADNPSRAYYGTEARARHHPRRLPPGARVARRPRSAGTRRRRAAGVRWPHARRGGLRPRPRARERRSISTAGA